MAQSAVLAISIVAIVLVSSVALVYLSGFPTGPTGTGSTTRSSTTPSTLTSSSTLTSPPSTSSTAETGVLEVHIPPHSGVAPPGFNVTSLLTGTFRYKFNFTVVLGVNNSIMWVNDDTIDHTISAFITPSGAQQFNSGLIPPGGTFSAILTVPGEYRYTCIWHPYLAGEIRVMTASP